MKKITLIFAVMATFSAALLAESALYIKLGTTTDTQRANQIEKTLAENGYTVHIKKFKATHTLFVGPYATHDLAVQELPTLRNRFPNSYILQTNLQNQKSVKPQIIGPNSQFFIQAGLGFHKADVKNSNVDEGTPSASGTTFGIGGGYSFDPYWISLEYMRLSGSDTTFDNIFATLNHNFYIKESTTLFGGVVLGMSDLTYKSNSFKGLDVKGGSSMMLGVQTGVQYQLPKDDLWLYATYSYIMLDHQTNFPNAGNIRHSSLNNLVIGIGYSF